MGTGTLSSVLMGLRICNLAVQGGGLRGRYFRLVVQPRSTGEYEKIWVSQSVVRLILSVYNNNLSKEKSINLLQPFILL